MISSIVRYVRAPVWFSVTSHTMNICQENILIYNTGTMCSTSVHIVVTMARSYHDPLQTSGCFAGSACIGLKMTCGIIERLESRCTAVKSKNLDSLYSHYSHHLPRLSLSAAIYLSVHLCIYPSIHLVAVCPAGSHQCLQSFSAHHHSWSGASFAESYGLGWLPWCLW